MGSSRIGSKCLIFECFIRYNDMSFIGNISVSNLSKYAALGGVFCVVTTLIGRRSLKVKYEEQPWCREPLKLLRNHTAAKYILGDGFQVGKIKEVSFQGDNPEEQNYYFPVGGKDGKGMFTIHADCQISRCFLEVSKSSTLSEEKYLSKQLVIYDRQKHGPLQYEEAAKKNKT